MFSSFQRGLQILPCKTGIPSILKKTSLPTTSRFHFTSQFQSKIQRRPITMLPLLTLEEHFVSPSVADDPDGLASHMEAPPQLMSKLLAIDSSRIKDMDTSSVSLQVLSHAPIVASLEKCMNINNELQAAITSHPTRYAGFALLPLEDPIASATELERCVKDLGFVGALLDNHLHGKFYDDFKFWPIFETAEKLDVPIYLHPTFASEDMMGRYRGNYDEGAALALSAFGWGWHVETGLHFLRLYCAGLFDKFPKLKVVIGHMGELLPFQYERLLGVSERMFGKKERGLKVVWEENLWITTSGMFSLVALECLLKMKGKEKVLFSIDYPFSGNDKGRKFIEGIEGSGLLNEEEMKAFAYGNAERLLKLKL